MSSEARHLPATYAAIVFKGNDLDLDLVSSIIGRHPTRSFRKGDQYKIKGIDYNRRFSLWVYSTRDIVNSDNLKLHIDLIEEMLIGAKSLGSDSRLNKIRELLESQKAELRIDVFWYGSKSAALPNISRSFDQVVTMAGGTVATDFHRDGDSVEAAREASHVSH